MENILVDKFVISKLIAVPIRANRHHCYAAASLLLIPVGDETVEQTHAPA